MNALEKHMRCIVQRFNPKKYWKYRQRVVGQNKYSRLLKLIYLFYIKRCDAFNNASLGTHLGYGAIFDTPPSLPHGLYGIIISHNAHIGKNATRGEIAFRGDCRYTVRNNSLCSFAVQEAKYDETVL